MLGQILKQYRQSTKKFQGDIAAELGISRNYLSKIERGESKNVSFELGVKILGLPNLAADGKAHRTVTVTVSRQIKEDAMIAQEVVWLNSMDIVTVSSCQGPPAIALILPSSKDRAAENGYAPKYQEDIGLFEISLRS